MANGKDKYVPSWTTGAKDSTTYTPSWINQQTQDKETVINEMPTFTEALASSFAEETTFGLYNDPSLDASELSSSASMGKAIGSDEKPVSFRNHVYKKSDSKGANPRPGFYTQDYRDNWDRIFGKKKKEQ